MIKEDKKSDSLKYELSKKCIYFLVSYYFSLVILGIICLLIIIAKLGTIKHEQMLLLTIIASISSAGMTCSMQYIRKLYRACITKRIISPDQENNTSLFGNLLYFLSRPFFSFIFTIITFFAVLSGFIIVIYPVEFVINDRFLYVLVIISSFIGFSTGRIIDLFEELSEKKVNSIFKKE
jgi:hypothetical protein